MFLVLLTICAILRTSIGCPGPHPCNDNGVYDEDCTLTCPKIYKPVCGEDGQTYGNSCVAGCYGVLVEHEGECGSRSCACPKIYDPVCGDDYVTYDNDCIAECSGAQILYEGECVDDIMKKKK